MKIEYSDGDYYVDRPLDRIPLYLNCPECKGRVQTQGNAVAVWILEHAPDGQRCVASMRHLKPFLLPPN